MPHPPSSRRPWLFPVKRIEDRHRFSTLAVCHVLIHPIALWVKPLQLDPGVGCGELPISLGKLLVADLLPGIHFLDQGLLVGDTSVATLRGQDAEFGFLPYRANCRVGACSATRTARRGGVPPRREKPRRAKPVCDTSGPNF